MVEKITKYKKYILGVIGTLIMLTMFIGVKYLMKPKYEPLPEVKLREIKSSKSFAIMVQNGDSYEEYTSEDNNWPGSDYVYKEAKCTDNNGKLVEDAITFANGKATLVTNQTVFCTLYFDAKKYKVETNFLDIDSEEQIIPPVITEGTLNQSFNIFGLGPSFRDYTFIKRKCINEKDEILYEDNIEYAEGIFDGSFDVMYCSYYYESEGYMLTILYWFGRVGGEAAAPTYSKKYKEGEQYSVDSPVIEGYNPSRSVFSGTMLARNIIFDVIYTAIPYTLTIKYVYEDGRIAYDDYYDTLLFGDSYSQASPEIPGYTPDIAIVSGVMPSHDLTITVTYYEDN